ncbi:MAG: CarD family transcriptional regulator [Chloroflexota bacterium]|jgi:RNA polymerase-interacting CarD/CdnL/TRCF family regulator
MTEGEHDVEKGDWFVHAHFGTGRINGQEVKCIGEQEQSYYELETAVCTLWLPEEKLFGQKVRPLASQVAFQEVMDVLKEPSEELAPEANKRKLQIKEVKAANEPMDTAEMVRDLWVREQVQGKLYDWERRAWRELCVLLIQEWALCQDISGEEARQQLAQTLTKEQSIAPSNGADDDKSSLLDLVATDEEKWSIWRAETAG